MSFNWSVVKLVHLLGGSFSAKQFLLILPKTDTVKREGLREAENGSVETDIVEERHKVWEEVWEKVG